MQLPKDGLTAVSRSTTVFINYLASEANAVAHVACRKTITAADVFKALENIELGGFVPTVKEELTKYEAVVARKKLQKSANAAAKDDIASTENVDEDVDNTITDDEEFDEDQIDQSPSRKSRGGSKPIKKARLDLDGDETEAEVERDSTRMDETVDEDDEDDEDDGISQSKSATDNTADNDNNDPERRVISSVPDERELAGEDPPDEINNEDDEEDDDAKATHFDVK